MLELPLCRWRREPTSEGRHACASPKLVTSPRGVLDSQCSSCYCRDHAPPPRPRGKCSHLGKRVDSAPCVPCAAQAGKRVEIPVHACAVHGRCTIAATIARTACCATCKQFSCGWVVPESGSVRHLIYHLFPRGHSWLWNLERLARSISLFNGKRIVFVALSGETAPRAEVEAALAPLQADLVFRQNDPELREMASFPALLELLSPYGGAGDCHLYAHAKGIMTHPVYPGVHEWREAMYDTLLDYWPAVQRALLEYPVAGCLLRDWCGLPHSRVKWHYSGSFRWIRHKELFAGDWRRMEMHWCGTEAYPALQFERSEAACLWGLFAAGGLGLYMRETWEQWARAELSRFRDNHVNDRVTPMILTVLLTAHRQPVLVHQAIESVRQQTSSEWELVILDSGKLAAEGAYDRYRHDARVRVEVTGETEADRAAYGMQGRVINAAMRKGLARGDLIVHLSDDDVLDPELVQRMLTVARLHAKQGAWYSSVRRVQLEADGREIPVGPLGLIGVLGPGNPGRCRVDGMQVVVRRSAWRPWSELRGDAPQADGIWIDAVAAETPIVPVAGWGGTHRFTPESTFTQRVL